MRLDEFLESDIRNAWIQEPPVNAYMRKAHRYINKRYYEPLDIASVEVEEDSQSRGFFKAFLQRVESLGKPVYIENVMTDRFSDFFRRRGYTEVKTGWLDSQPSSFFLEGQK